MPNDITMAGGYVVRIVAISPTDGSAITGVRATDVAFQVQNTSPGGASTDPMLGNDPLPLLVPTDQTA